MTKTLLELPRLESIKCNPCAGTGLRSGNDCARCAGLGSFLTKRGKAASAYMKTLLEKPASDVSMGDVVWFPVSGVKVATAVLRVDLNVGPTHRIRLHGKRRKTDEDIAFTVAKGGLVDLAHTPQELAEIRAKVEAYQGRLKKTGEELKRPRQLKSAA